MAEYPLRCSLGILTGERYSLGGGYSCWNTLQCGQGEKQLASLVNKKLTIYELCYKIFWLNKTLVNFCWSERLQDGRKQSIGEFGRFFLAKDSLVKRKFGSSVLLAKMKFKRIASKLRKQSV